MVFQMTLELFFQLLKMDMAYAYSPFPKLSTDIEERIACQFTLKKTISRHIH